MKKIADYLISSQAASEELARVSPEEYEQFCNEYVFDALRGKSFGRAFCERFNIVDFLLVRDQPDDWAKQYIRNCGYVRWD